MIWLKGFIILGIWLVVSSAHKHDDDDYQLLVVGNSVKTSMSNTELIDLQTNTSCSVAPIPSYINGGFGAFFNDKAFVCNFNTKECFVYNKEFNTWFYTGGMHSIRDGSAYAFINQKHLRSKKFRYPDDVMLWAVGGQDSYLANLKTTEIYKGETWKQSSINLPVTGLYAPCLVTISQHETALIGGQISTNTFSKDIYVYNWRKHTWTLRGQLPFPLAYSHCTMMRNPTTKRNAVMILGGTLENGSFTNSFLIWDPKTLQITNGTQIPIAATWGVAFAVGEKLFLATDPTNKQNLYTFTFKSGWQFIKDSMFLTYWGLTFAVPRNLFTCN